MAFGKHGKVPEGKAVLDKSKDDGILSKYIGHFVDLCLFINTVGLFHVLFYNIPMHKLLINLIIE